MKFISFFLLILFLFATIFSCSVEKNKVEKIEPKVIFPDGFVVDVRLAISESEKALGLMFVPELNDNQGMFFINDYDSLNPYWMKNCLINLDLIFLDKDLNIVDIIDNVPPCESEPCPLYSPSKLYRYVLEVRGNLAKEHNLKLNDRIVVLGFSLNTKI